MAALGGYNNIRNYVDKTPELGISPTLLNEIIKRLIDDGYITERQVPGIGGQPVYHITFNGLIFDGYVIAKRQADERESWEKNITRATIRNSNWLTWLTVILAIPSAVAAWYYGIEIYKCYWPEVTAVECKKIPDS